MVLSGSIFIHQTLSRIANASALVIGSLGLNTFFHEITCPLIQNFFAASTYFIIQFHSEGISVKVVESTQESISISIDLKTIAKNSALVAWLSGLNVQSEKPFTAHFNARNEISFLAKLELVSLKGFLSELTVILLSLIETSQVQSVMTIGSVLTVSVAPDWESVVQVDVTVVVVVATVVVVVDDVEPPPPPHQVEEDVWFAIDKTGAKYDRWFVWKSHIFDESRVQVASGEFFSQVLQLEDLNILRVCHADHELTVNLNLKFDQEAVNVTQDGHHAWTVWNSVFVLELESRLHNSWVVAFSDAQVATVSGGTMYQSQDAQETNIFVTHDKVRDHDKAQDELVSDAIEIFVHETLKFHHWLILQLDRRVLHVLVIDHHANETVLFTVMSYLQIHEKNVIFDHDGQDASLLLSFISLHDILKIFAQILIFIVRDQVNPSKAIDFSYAVDHQYCHDLSVTYDETKFHHT